MQTTFGKHWKRFVWNPPSTDLRERERDRQTGRERETAHIIGLEVFYWTPLSRWMLFQMKTSQSNVTAHGVRFMCRLTCKVYFIVIPQSLPARGILESYIVFVCQCVSWFCPDGIFWTAQPSVSKLGVLVHRPEPGYSEERLVCLLSSRFALFEVESIQPKYDFVNCYFLNCGSFCNPI